MTSSGEISRSGTNEYMRDESRLAQLHRVIRDVPDFPSPGIVFKDITPLLMEPVLLADAIQAMVQPFAETGITHVAAIESRGFLFGPSIAMAIGARLVLIRKPNKLPWHSIRAEYTLEYGTDALEVHRDAMTNGARVLIVDDILATGGTAVAAAQLVSVLSGTLCGATFLGELPALSGRKNLQRQYKHCAVASVLQF